MFSECLTLHLCYGGASNKICINSAENADFDGDELNSIGDQLPEIGELFKGLSPTNMLINRVDETIKMGPSALENVSLAIFSDIG